MLLMLEDLTKTTSEFISATFQILDQYQNRHGIESTQDKQLRSRRW